MTRKTNSLSTIDDTPGIGKAAADASRSMPRRRTRGAGVQSRGQAYPSPSSTDSPEHDTSACNTVGVAGGIAEGEITGGELVLTTTVPVAPTFVTPSSLADLVGQRLALFEDIVLPTPAQVECIRQMDTLRVMGIHQPPGQQRRAFRYLNQSGSGKSTCAKLLKRHVEAQPGRIPGLKPVLHVTLSTTGTPKSLATSILNAFEDGYSTRGEAELLLERVKVGFEEFSVELLIIDELNHLKQKHLAEDAANTIKNILTKGWVPIVLMGTTDAKPLFMRNRELKNRCAPQIVLEPFNFTDDASLAVWTELLRRLDVEMVARGILRESSHLGDPVLAMDLCEASNGLIGEFHNIVLAALESTLLAGEGRISYERLVAAIDAWCLQDETIGHNPLRLRRER